jgi:glycerophosphoryl diester phosphodiesterase
MEIIAHRGYWKIKSEQNTLGAFKRAFDMGFGIETDFRDLCGQLVISHDLPSNHNYIDAQQFLDLYSEFRRKDLTLAINIKSDGLHKLIANFIEIGNNQVTIIKLINTLNAYRKNYKLVRSGKASLCSRREIPSIYP